MINHIKDGYRISGDHAACRRLDYETFAVLADGIGSGAYANVAAVTCATRLLERFSMGGSFRSSVLRVAASMTAANMDRIPYAAFSAIQILENGFFTVLTFEAPAPLLITLDEAIALSGRVVDEAGKVREYIGTLDLGQSIAVFSDGFSEAGMGRGYHFGFTSEGIAGYISRLMSDNGNLAAWLEQTAQHTAVLSGGFVDDTTALALTCRAGRQLAVATGPPREKDQDRDFAHRFMTAPGRKAICGSTTADLIARELGLTLEIKKAKNYLDPPEYGLPGVDLISEGAIALNRVYNILDDFEEPEQPNVVERLTAELLHCDKLTVFHGRALNTAHQASLFKQLGIHPRQDVVNLIVDYLKNKGKIIERINF